VKVLKDRPDSKDELNQKVAKSMGTG
jgi:hypothetical protein